MSLKNSEEPVDERGNISISNENTLKLLKENTNENINAYVLAVVDFLQDYSDLNSKLEAENKEMRETIKTLKEVIKSLTHQHEDKGE